MEKENNFTYSAADLMPQDELSRQILLARAENFSKEMQTIKKEATTHYIRFRIGNNEYYGIPYDDAQRVLDNVVITKIPHSAKYIAGVINFRGSLLTIIDLTKFFQIPSSDQAKYVIVTKIRGIVIGIIADNIEGIAEYEKLSDEMRYHGMIDSKYVLGIHDNNTTLLNMDAIMNDLQLLLASH